MPEVFTYIDRSELSDSFYLDLCSRTECMHPSQDMELLDCMTSGKWVLLYDQARDLGFSVPYSTKIPGVKQVYLPQLIQQMRVLGSGDITNLVYDDLYAEVSNHFKTAVFSLAHFIPSATFRNRQNNLINLEQGYAQISARYKAKFRNALKLSGEQLRFSDSISSSEFMNLYRSQNTSGRIAEEDFQRISQLIKNKLSNTEVFLCCARDKNDVIVTAGLWLVNQHYVFSGIVVSTTEAKQMNGAHYLFDQVIRKFSGSRRIFDFCGSDMPGVALWMNHFRPDKKEYAEYVIDELSPLLKGVISTVKGIKSIIK